MHPTVGRRGRECDHLFCNSFDTVFAPGQRWIGFGLAARIRRDLVRGHAILAEKTMRMAGEAVAPLAGIDHQYEPACPHQFASRRCGSSPDPSLGRLRPGCSPGFPAVPGGLWHGAERVRWRQRYGGAGFREAPAHFAFQFVGHAACVFLTAQCPQSPFTGQGHQFIVL